MERFYPTGALITAGDIIFFWVARMMMLGLHFMGDVPFHKVVVNALIRDEHGQKMSKTKGNVVDPLELIDDYGADALRFTMAALSGQVRNVSLSRPRIEGYRNFGTKLWNAARFCQMNGCERVEGFDPASVRHVQNRWIRGEALKTSAAGDRRARGLRFRRRRRRGSTASSGTCSAIGAWSSPSRCWRPAARRRPRPAR